MKIEIDKIEFDAILNILDREISHSRERLSKSIEDNYEPDSIKKRMAWLNLCSNSKEHLLAQKKNFYSSGESSPAAVQYLECQGQNANNTPSKS